VTEETSLSVPIINEQRLLNNKQALNYLVLPLIYQDQVQV
jgi:hypothetical protein